MNMELYTSQLSQIFYWLPHLSVPLYICYGACNIFTYYNQKREYFLEPQQQLIYKWTHKMR